MGCGRGGSHKHVCVSFEEAKAGGNDNRTAKALAQIFTIIDSNEGSNDRQYAKIERTIFPNAAKTPNEKNDVAIVFEAAKYNAILVTHDGGSKSQPGGILGNRDKLRDYVKILSDTAAMEFIKRKIANRDSHNERVARECGGKLPEGTGKD